MKRIICNIQLSHLLFVLVILVFSCNDKDNNTTSTPTTYSSMAEFYNANGVKSETFTINGATGGSFVSAKGTKVTVPPDVFLNANNTPMTGMVKIEFKDIYEKSDMLLSNMPTIMDNGAPLRSGGEFFIKATDANDASNALLLSGGTPIKIGLQGNNFPGDTSMKGYIWNEKPSGDAGWQISNNPVRMKGYDYEMEVINFNPKGTWLNSDDPYYFSRYTQTLLTINPTVNPDDYDMDVFLLFKGVNAAVSMGRPDQGKFTYSYAPVGLQCTVVALGAKGGKLHISLTDITIGATQTVNIGLQEYTDVDFKAKLKALND